MIKHNILTFFLKSDLKSKGEAPYLLKGEVMTDYLIHNLFVFQRGWSLIILTTGTKRL